jgi:hypothetical protein
MTVRMVHPFPEIWMVFRELILRLEEELGI